MGRNVDTDTDAVEEEAGEIMETMETPVDEVVEVTETAEAPAVDPDAGMTIIDKMIAGEGETLFSVSKVGKDGTKFRSYLAFKFGATLAEMVELLGEEIVFEYAKSAGIVKAQAITRPLVGAGRSAIDTIKSWIPGVKRTAAPIDKKAVANEFIQDASVEELEAMIAAIQNKM